MLIDRPAASTYIGTAQHAVSRWALHSCAALALMLSLAALIVFWPIPFWGTTIDLTNGLILSVDPDSMAERGGILVGDRITAMYNYTWDDSSRQLVLEPMNWSSVSHVPIRVERAGRTLDLILPIDQPTASFQLEKLVAFVLAFIFWLAGYTLGLVRRHERHGTPVVAWFWIILSAIVGCYTFALYESYPLLLGLQWLLITVMLPISVYIHIWFPARPIAQHEADRGRRWIQRFILALQLLFFGTVLLVQPPALVLIDRLNILIPLFCIVTCVVNGIQLFQVYRTTTIAHVRRQVSLIAYACLLVAILWTLLRSIPLIFFQELWVSAHWLDLMSGLIPLAYLVGGSVPDLFRTIRGVRWLIGHLLTAVVASLLVMGVVYQFDLQGPLAAAWIGVGVVMLYRPIRSSGHWLFSRSQRRITYQPFLEAARQLSTTLDVKHLVRILQTSVQAVFADPPIGVYLGDLQQTNALTLTVHDRLRLPPTISPGVLTEQLRCAPSVCESRVLAAMLPMDLDEATTELINHSGITLWCPLLHPTRGHLLGLLVIGLRGDLDPYRADDFIELRRLLDTAMLAFANSAAYRELQQSEQMVRQSYRELEESEQTIRQLYQRVQQARDARAAEIARDIHDEVINVHVRLNIETLKQLIHINSVADIQQDLNTLLESERSVGQALRMVCEDLHPIGIDDPYGLPGVLRRQVDAAAGMWRGRCHFTVEGTPLPISAPVQWEALRILRESITNAIKHAINASDIWVALTYLPTPSSGLCLTIQDNGQGAGPIQPRSGNWGLRDMYEGARTVGGQLEVRRTTEGGACVTFHTAVDLEEIDNGK